MRFYGVTFQDGTNEILPEHWFTGDKKESCQYLSKRGKSDVVRLVKSLAKPDPTWKSYKCSVKCSAGKFNII